MAQGLSCRVIARRLEMTVKVRPLWIGASEGQSPAQGISVNSPNVRACSFPMLTNTRPPPVFFGGSVTPPVEEGGREGSPRSRPGQNLEPVARQPGVSHASLFRRPRRGDLRGFIRSNGLGPTSDPELAGYPDLAGYPELACYPELVCPARVYPDRRATPARVNLIRHDFQKRARQTASRARQTASRSRGTAERHEKPDRFSC
jgi:hypothetical protein